MKFKKMQNKVVVITGAAQGIGKVIARVFAEQGASVVIADIQENLGNSVAKSMQDSGLNVVFFKTNLRKEEDIKGLIEFTIEKFKQLDILINNAKPKLQRLPFSESLQEWDLAMDILLKAPVFASKYALPYLSKSDNGAIINIGSTNALSISYQPAAYHIAKAGLLHFTRYLAYEFGSKGVRVNAICPGLVNISDKKEQIINEDKKIIIENTIPLKRAAKPEEIAEAALFLSSDSSSIITGQTLILDGGAELGDSEYIALKNFYKNFEKK